MEIWHSDLINITTYIIKLTKLAIGLPLDKSLSLSETFTIGCAKSVHGHNIAAPCQGQGG